MKFVIEDPSKVEGVSRSIYPAELEFDVGKRIKRFLTGGLGLTQFGVNLATLEPGGMSSFRHWHAKEDECIYVLEGELWLVTEAGETRLPPGAIAGFPAGDAVAHHLVNRSEKPATYLEIGTRAADESVVYPDVDLKLERRNGVNALLHKSGEPY